MTLRRLLIALLPLTLVSLALVLAAKRAESWKPHLLHTCTVGNCSCGVEDAGTWHIEDGGKTVLSGSFAPGLPYPKDFDPSSEQLATVTKQSGGQSPVLWSHDGQKVLVMDTNGSGASHYYDLYPFGSRQRICRLNADPDMFTAHDFSPDDSLIVLDDTGRTGYSIVDASTGSELWKVDGFAYQFSNDSRYLVVLDLQGLGSKDCHYRIHDSHSGKLLNEALPPHPTDGAMQPQFHLSPDGGYILAPDDSTGTWMLRVR